MRLKKTKLKDFTNSSELVDFLYDLTKSSKTVHNSLSRAMEGLKNLPEKTHYFSEKKEMKSEGVTFFIWSLFELKIK